MPTEAQDKPLYFFATLPWLSRSLLSLLWTLVYLPWHIIEITRDLQWFYRAWNRYILCQTGQAVTQEYINISNYYFSRVTSTGSKRYWVVFEIRNVSFGEFHFLALKLKQKLLMHTEALDKLLYFLATFSQFTMTLWISAQPLMDIGVHTLTHNRGYQGPTLVL